MSPASPPREGAKRGRESVEQSPPSHGLTWVYCGVSGVSGVRGVSGVSGGGRE